MTFEPARLRPEGLRTGCVMKDGKTFAFIVAELEEPDGGAASWTRNTAPSPRPCSTPSPGQPEGAVHRRQARWALARRPRRSAIASLLAMAYPDLAALQTGATGSP